MLEGRTESILKSYICSNFPIYIVSVTPLDLRKCQIDKQMIIGPDDRPSLCGISYLSSQPPVSFFSSWLAWLHLFYVPSHCDFAWNRFSLYCLWYLKIFKCSSFYTSWFIGVHMQRTCRLRISYQMLLPFNTAGKCRLRIVKAVWRWNLSEIKCSGLGAKFALIF